jgi:hypothetical protein
LNSSSLALTERREALVVRLRQPSATRTARSGNAMVSFRPQLPHRRSLPATLRSSTTLGRHPGDPLDRGNAARSVSARHDRAFRLRGARVRVVRDGDRVAFDDHGKADVMPQAGCWPRKRLRSPEAPRLARTARRWFAGSGRNLIAGPVTSLRRLKREDG